MDEQKQEMTQQEKNAQMIREHKEQKEKAAAAKPAAEAKPKEPTKDEKAEIRKYSEDIGLPYAFIRFSRSKA